MSSNISTKDAFAFAELLEILSYMEEDDVNKLPQKLMDIFKENADKEYQNHIDINIPLEEQNISEDTTALLGMLAVNYWCSTEEEKQMLLEAYEENEKTYQESLREKYNPDTIFDNQKSTSTTEATDFESTETSTIQSNLPIDYQAFPWYKKVFTNIRNFVYKLLHKGKTPT